jgi:hypothetical protein
MRTMVACLDMQPIIVLAYKKGSREDFSMPAGAAAATNNNAILDQQHM